MTEPAAQPEAFDPRALRRAFGSFATGVTVITTVDRMGRRWGMTANSFSSVSLDPPLVLWSQALTAPSHAAFRESGRFAINILSEEQVEASRRFATAGADKFQGIRVRSGLAGIPLLEDCVAWIECTTEAVHPGGDHALFLGRVQRFDHADRRPLVFALGRYSTARPHPACA